jgi:hypothetical protein
MQERYYTCNSELLCEEAGVTFTIGITKNSNKLKIEYGIFV